MTSNKNVYFQNSDDDFYKEIYPFFINLKDAPINNLNKEDQIYFNEIQGYIEKNSGLVSLSGTLVPAKMLNNLISKIPIVGNILVGEKAGEGIFGISFKMKGLPGKVKTTVNPIKTLTPRFISRALEQMKKNN